MKEFSLEYFEPTLRLSSIVQNITNIEAKSGLTLVTIVISFGK